MEPSFRDCPIRSDLFSFGVVLYEMATGLPPFGGESTVDILNSILHQDPIPALRVSPALPRELVDVIEKALEKNPDLRYQHASDIRTDLQRLKRDSESQRHLAAASRAGSVIGQPSFSRIAPLGHKKRWFFAASIAIGMVAALGLYYHSHQGRRLTEKDTVVLADFDNRTGEPVFNDTLKTALNVSLRQSPFLNVPSESQVGRILQEMTRASGTKLTSEVVREVCQRSNSRAYISGSIGNLGDEWFWG